jgi:hypothetical protein
VPDPVPLTEQAAEVKLETEYRDLVYPWWVETGAFAPQTAAVKLGAMRAAAATLEWMAEHADGLRTLGQFLISNGAGVEPTPEERAALLAHPAVRAVLDDWPSAEVVGIRPITIPAPEGASVEERQDA